MALAEVADPVPLPGQVLVQVVASSQRGNDFDVIADSVGGATFGLAIEHPGPAWVLVNITTQVDAETVTFRAKGFDRARGARIYMTNQSDTHQTLRVERPIATTPEAAWELIADIGFREDLI